MAPMDKESLFSLDVVVDTLSLGSQVTCRFPAVAVRLLDFPTLLIYHVEPDLGDAIKKKIDADPLYKLPKQLTELQDKNGAYAVKKGKSCLFKVSPNTLQTHLQSTPLYVMLIDTYPEVPKLVASCTVALDGVMEEIYEDICNHGVSVPSTHGEKGEYQLCNLMGRDVGNLSIGVRLLSLGVGLLPHLPESSVAKLKKKAVVRKETREKDEVEEEPIALYDLDVPETHDMPTQVAIYPEKSVEHFHTQTEKEIQNAGTQTKSLKKKLRRVPNEQLKLDKVQDEINDFFVTNAECPPPLYFNSETEIKSGQTLLLSHYPLGLPSEQDCSSGIEDESIRSEDTFSDGEMASSKIFKPTLKKLTMKDAVQQPAPKKPTPPQQPAGNLSNLPILNALLQEIVTLQGGQLQTGSTDIMKKLVKKPKAFKSPERTPRDQSPPVKETQETFSSRMSSPRRAPPGKPTPRPSSPPGLRKHVCEAGRHEILKEPPKTVNKGWIRNQAMSSSQEVKKTKLQYGMTNTQRLRLAKGNPELLKALEKEQEAISQRRREQMLKKWTGVFNKTADISTEISRHQLEGTGRLEGVPLLDLGDSLDMRHHHKRPVPTPRMSISARGLEEGYDETSSEYSPVPPITPRKSLQNSQVQMIPERDSSSKARQHRDPDLSSNSSRTQSSRIEVHVPSMSLGSDDEANSINDSELGDLPPPRKRLGATKTLYNPGFPITDSIDSRTSVLDSRTSIQYSEDFDGLTSTFTEEPALRKVVDKYSDDSDSLTNNQDRPATETFEGVSAGDELGLKCVVDRYSDDASSSTSSQHLKIQLPAPSNYSPDTMSIKPQDLPATRKPFTAVSLNDALSATQDSTAYLRRSEMSVDSTVASMGRPQPSPRGPRSSVRTESVSSYDGENVSPLRTENTHSDEYDYSEDEDHQSRTSSSVSYDYSAGSGYVPSQPLSVKDMRVAPEAKLGYTWAG